MYAELLSLTYDVMPAEYASVIITEFGKLFFVPDCCNPSTDAWHSSAFCSMFSAATSCSWCTTDLAGHGLFASCRRDSAIQRAGHPAGVPGGAGVRV